MSAPPWAATALAKPVMNTANTSPKAFGSTRRNTRDIVSWLGAWSQATIRLRTSFRCAANNAVSVAVTWPHSVAATMITRKSHNLCDRFGARRSSTPSKSTLKPDIAAPKTDKTAVLKNQSGRN